jgi:hypothetical protein
MMPIPATKSPNSARTNLFAVLALLLLAANQLVFAGHQFEHVADEVFEVCGVCLQLERSGDLLSADIEERYIGAAPLIVPALEIVATADARHRVRQPRGPPTP